MKTSKTLQFALLSLAVIGGMILLPQGLGLYSVELLNIFLVNVILVCSYRMTVTTGDWGLAHIVMMGVGGYSAALLAKDAGFSIYLTIPAAGLIAAFVAYVMSLPLSRTVGFGYFIASFAIAELVRLSWLKFDTLFGGVRGLINIPIGKVFGYSLFDPVIYYYLSLAVAVICLLLMFQIDRSRIGIVWRSLSTDADLARSGGINVHYYRKLAFMCGSAFAGVAGALLVHRLGSVDPKGFDLTTMIYLVIWVVVGGTGSFWGPIAGLIVMTFFFEWTREFLAWRPLFFGGILILFLIFLPNGLDGLLRKLFDKVTSPGGAQQ